MANLVYVGPRDLRGELERLIRSKGLSAESVASPPEPGCDYESTTLAVGETGGDGSLDRQCHEVVAEWNAKYPHFGIWIEE